MKLKLDYTGGKQGFELNIELDADIAQDAEAIGYITNVLFESAKRLGTLMETANPKYQGRLALGVLYSKTEQEREQNTNYPFTTYIIRDEPS